MSDDALSAEIAALKARLADLEHQHATQQVEASNQSMAHDIQQISGSGNILLKQVSVAPGGRLIIDSIPLPPPNDKQISIALTIYLETLLNHYRLLSFQGLSVSSQRKYAQITIQSVFINLRTNLIIPELASIAKQHIRRRKVFIDPSGTLQVPIELQPSSEDMMYDDLKADTRLWLDELLDEDALNELKTTKHHIAELDFLANPRTIVECVRHYPTLVVTGMPGSGKTTVLRYLALCFALAHHTASPPDGQLGIPWSGVVPFPILVQLRRFADALTNEPLGAVALVTHLDAIIAEQHIPHLKEYLDRQLQAGHILVLLDGIDEIVDQTKRRWVIQAIDLFRARYPTSRIVVTSRPYAYVPPFQLSDHFQVVAVQPIDPAEQAAFIQRWYAAALAHDPALATTRQQDLVQAIRQRPRLYTIAENPLLLTLMTLLHFGEATSLPDQRTELYEKCLLLLLDEWEVLRNGIRLDTMLGVTFRKSDLLPLVQPIAYHLQAAGREEATLEEVRGWVFEHFFNFMDGNAREAKVVIERFLEVVESRSGLLVARDIRQRYALPHRTFQEYLAMRELVSANIVTREVLAHRHDPTWREVLLLLVGHLVGSGHTAQATHLISLLLDSDPQGSEPYYRTVTLTGEMVEELGKTLDRQGQFIKTQVIQELGIIVVGGHLSTKERVAAAFTLGRLGDPRIRMPEQPAYWSQCEQGDFWFGNALSRNFTKASLPHSFHIGQYLVTNIEYARFIHDGGYTNKRWWTNDGWAFLQPSGHPWDDNDNVILAPRHWNDSQYNAPTQPVVGVSWYEAMAYCTWISQRLGILVRLPTALEWERVARYTDQRRYPWGNSDPTADHGNWRETDINFPTPVGCFPKGKSADGIYDLIGNVGELLATSASAITNPVALLERLPGKDILRSQSDFRTVPDIFYCNPHHWIYPDDRYSFLGFRLCSPSLLHWE